MSVPQTSAVERLLDVVAYLLAQKRPVPARRLFDELADLYQGSTEARERKFSRDKEELRSLGVNVVFHELEDEEEGGYTIDRSAFYIPDIAFTPDERASLFAVGAAAQTGAFPLKRELAHALVKLRAVTDADEDRVGPALYASGRAASPHAALLAKATTDRTRLRLRYGATGEERLVDPYVCTVRRGRCTIVGFCHLRKEVRTFHAERVVACEVVTGKQGEFQVPAGFDPAAHLPTFPWQVRLHPPIEVQLSFATTLLESGPRALGLEGTTCWTTNLDGLIAQVLALGAGARIVGPEQARARVRELLGGLS